MSCNRYRSFREVLCKFLVKDINFVSFSFTAFVNKVIFLGFAFIFSLLSLLSLTFPAAKHTS